MLLRRLSEARDISFYGGSELFGEEKKTRVQGEREDRWFDLFVIGTLFSFTCLLDYSP
jgi:hypothetical protein